MARHFAYVVLCRDGSLYAGYTTDPSRRVAEHNAGAGSRYTRGRLPVKLVYAERRRSRGDALKREAEIKRMTRSAKMRMCGLSLR